MPSIRAGVKSWIPLGMLNFLLLMLDKVLCLILPEDADVPYTS